MGGNKSEQEFVGVILAGGKSSRMGKDKAFLELDGMPMLQRAANVMTDLGASRLIVCRNEFEQGYLPDIYPHHGPLSGIHAALFETKLPLLVMPVDMPLVDVPVMSSVLEAGLATQAATHYQDHPLPLFVPNTKEVKSYLERCLSKPDGDKSKTSMKRFLAYVGSVILTTSNEAKLANANTPDEWQHYATLNRIYNVSKNID